MANPEALASACKRFEEKLVLHYYGECPASESGELEAHVKDCAACNRFLEDLRAFLPKTVAAKELPERYWRQYYAELVDKLDAADRRTAWWRNLFPLRRAWLLPAAGTVVVLLLATALVFTRGVWRPEGGSSKEMLLKEIAADPGRIEFFRAMEMLESLELLESLEGDVPGGGSVRSL